MALTIITLLHVPRGHMTDDCVISFCYSFLVSSAKKETKHITRTEAVFISLYGRPKTFSVWTKFDEITLGVTSFTKLRSIENAGLSDARSSDKAEVHRWRVKKRDAVEVLINFQHSVSLYTQRRNTVLIMTTLNSNKIPYMAVNFERNAHNYKSWGVRPQVMAVAFACYN